jgi:hypothetical protein
MLLQNVLKGKTQDGQRKIDRYFSSKQNKKKLNVLWYPSAGNDFFDVVHVMHHSLQGKLSEQDMFIHTDYMPEWVDLSPGVKYHDNLTTVEILENTEFEVNNSDSWQYEINPFFVDFPEQAYPLGRGSLLKIRLNISNTTIEIYILYFFLENHNFLDLLLKQILRNHSSEISINIAKVREGIAWGGVKESRSVLNSIVRHLSILKPEFMFLDNSNCTNNSAWLTGPYDDIELKDYSLKLKYSLSWSLFRVVKYEVSILNSHLTPKREMEILKQIHQQA